MKNQNFQMFLFKEYHEKIKQFNTSFSAEAKKFIVSSIFEEKNVIFYISKYQNERNELSPNFDILNSNNRKLFEEKNELTNQIAVKNNLRIILL